MLSDNAFRHTVTSIPENAKILDVMDRLGLPDCYLTAGCLFQPIWNRKSDQPDLWGVKDFDVFYFDNDVSWGAENDVIERAAEPLGPLSDRVEIRNQARVHLWYEQRFGSPIAPFTQSLGYLQKAITDTITCICL